MARTAGWNLLINPDNVIMNITGPSCGPVSFGLSATPYRTCGNTAKWLPDVALNIIIVFKELQVLAQLTAGDTGYFRIARNVNSNAHAILKGRSLIIILKLSC